MDIGGWRHDLSKHAADVVSHHDIEGLVTTETPLLIAKMLILHELSFWETIVPKPIYCFPTEIAIDAAS